MVALYERPEIKKRNRAILRAVKAGKLSRKEIATKHEVDVKVVHNVVYQARVAKRLKVKPRRCSCGRRRR